MTYNIIIKDVLGNELLKFENVKATSERTKGFYSVDNKILEDKVITFELTTDKAIASEEVSKLEGTSDEV